MGLKSLNQSEWFEVDKQYPDYHRIRKHRIATRGHNVVRLLSAKEIGNGDVVREGVCAQAGESIAVKWNEHNAQLASQPSSYCSPLPITLLAAIRDPTSFLPTGGPSLYLR